MVERPKAAEKSIMVHSTANRKFKKKRIDVAGGGTWSAGGVGVDVGVATPPPLLQAPSFVVEPPALVEFSNGTGAWIHCVARGHPPPQVTAPGS